MKTYFMNFTRGAAEHKVVVRDADTGETSPLTHHERHTTGLDAFNWGYGGSGPAELARCLLLDHLGFNDESAHVMNAVRSALGGADKLVPPILYQQFKVDVVAQKPMGESWILTGDEIDDWLNTKGAWHRERMAS